MRRNLAVSVFLASIAILPLCNSRVEGGIVSLAWNPCPDPAIVGYSLHYGSESHNYTSTLDAGPNCGLTVEDLIEGATYFFAVSSYNSQGWESVSSDELRVTVSFPPVIIVEPSSQTTQAGAPVVMLVEAIGTPPLTFQWFDGIAAISGATNSVLKLPKVSSTNTGNYVVIVNNFGGSARSAEATVTVIDPPSTWSAMSGGSATVLRAGGGSAGGKLQPPPSPVASTVSAVGAYNGLFYQTNGGGMPAITLQTAGLLTQCVVDAQGNFAGTLYINDVSNSLSGAFDAAGNGSAAVSGAEAGLSDLAVTLHLGLNAGAPIMLGVVSNLDQQDPWTAILTAEPETNAFAQPPNFVLTIPPINGLPGGWVTGVEGSGTMSLLGILGDGTIFSQNAPVSCDGNIALFVQLYGQSGLLAGWVNAFGGPPTCLLTWICPSGPASSGFTNIVEAMVAPDSLTAPASSPSSPSSQLGGEKIEVQSSDRVSSE